VDGRGGHLWPPTSPLLTKQSAKSRYVWQSCSSLHTVAIIHEVVFHTNNHASDVLCLAPHPDLKLDLSQLDTKRQVPEKVVPVVPHNEPEVRQLVNSSLDVFWEKRRYGESWQGVVPPSSYLAPDVPVIGVAATEKAEASRKAYKSLVFDLTSEILTDLYSEEADDGGDKPWVPQSTAALRGIGRKAPTTLPDVRPLVGDQVSRLLGVHQTLGRPAVVPKVVVTRRRPDAVDRVLYQELQEEEPNWVTYDSDELDVKLQLSDAIMDLLLAETIACVTDVAGKKLR
jgi:centrosomal protein CEP350